MNILSFTRVTVLLGLILTIGVTHAGVILDHKSYTLGGTGLSSGTFSTHHFFDGFDTAYGELTSVDLRLTVSGSVEVTGSTVSPPTTEPGLRAEITDRVGILGESFPFHSETTLFDESTSGCAIEDSLCVTKLSGDFGYTESYSLDSLHDIDLFKSSWTINPFFELLAVYSPVWDSGADPAVFDLTYDISYKVFYSYVTEPGSLGLLLTGLLAVRLVRRNA